MLARVKQSIVAVSALVFLNNCAPIIIGGATTVGMAVHDRRTVGTVVEDRAIEFKAYELLRQQQRRLARSHVAVTSYNNVVLLSGEVETAQLRDWVEQTVSRVEKVRKVHNELLVGPPSPLASRSNDSWITAKAKSALLQISGLPSFDPSRVKILTERGNVYLLGLVSQQEGDAVTHIVRQISGVQQVVKLFEYI